MSDAAVEARVDLTDAEPPGTDEEPFAAAPSPQAGPVPDARTVEIAGLRRLVAAILVLHLIAALYFAKDLILPLILGVLLALTFSPLVRATVRAGAPTAMAAGSFVCLLGSGAVALILSLSDRVSELAAEAPRLGFLLRQKLAGLNASVEAVKDASEEVEKIADAALSSGEPTVVVAQPGMLGAAIGNLAGGATTLAVAFVLALFILAAGRGVHAKLVRAFPTFREKRNALETVYEIEIRISRYLLTITLINAGLGLAIFLAFLAVGMPYAYLWGIGAFLLNFIPFVGTAIGTATAAAVSIVTFDSIGYAMLAPLAYLALGSLEGQVVTPSILGRRLELSAIAVLVSLIFWTWAWGVAGALLAVPLLVLVKAVADRIDALRTLALLLSSEPEARDP